MPNDLTDFELALADPSYCQPSYVVDRENPEREGWRWKDEHGEPCETGDDAFKVVREVVENLDEMIRSVPLLGTAWKYAALAFTKLAKTDTKAKRQASLRRAWAGARRDACLRVTSMRVDEEVEFLDHNGYGPLLEFVAQPGWLGFDSPMAAYARRFVFGEARPAWGLSEPDLDLHEEATARFLGHVEANTEVRRYDYFMTAGAGMRFVVDTASDLPPDSGNWLPQLEPNGPVYYGTVVRPSLPPKLVERIRTVCTSHLPFNVRGEEVYRPHLAFERIQREQQAASSRCFRCLYFNLNLLFGLQLSGQPRGDVKRGFDRIERRFAPELAYLRRQGVRVGRPPPGVALVLGWQGGRDAPIRRLVAPMERRLGAQRRKERRKEKVSNTVLVLGTAALLGAVWWKRRR